MADQPWDFDVKTDSIRELIEQEIAQQAAGGAEFLMLLESEHAFRIPSQFKWHEDRKTELLQKAARAYVRTILNSEFCDLNADYYLPAEDA